MDIAAITDLKELKALAYDQLVLQQQAENNLKLINQRIEQLTQPGQSKDISTKAGKKAE